ncbi:3-hydroxyanthranilic acid dioxygenase [Linnemannia elongata]|nr:3-hydroxyanthranilic acid dioxygenase [Linnemannia elongata]
MIALPINFGKWIEEHKDKLQPPVNNYLVQRGDFIIMAEWFYQHKGDMLLKVVDDGAFKDIPIKEGEMFLLPANTPHNPVRFADTVGIVIERQRPAEALDRLRWYCEKCAEIVYEESFHCVDLGKQLAPVINRYAADVSLRKCKSCGHTNTAK